MLRQPYGDQLRSEETKQGGREAVNGELARQSSRRALCRARQRPEVDYGEVLTRSQNNGSRPLTQVTITNGRRRQFVASDILLIIRVLHGLDHDGRLIVFGPKRYQP